MKFYYFSFKEYSKIDPKVRDQFLFLSTAYTVPSYWNGLEFKPFVPSKELFYDACIDFKTSQFEERYKCQIYSLNLHDIFNELKQMSNGKDIVFLVWEDETRGSERDIFIPWLTNSSLKDIKNFSFSRALEMIDNDSASLFKI